jgi:pyruvate ferredoxin oxidoreductase gamma subunit
LKEIRIHGRGGQGSVVMAEMIALSAFEEGKYPQAFPYLGGGGERRGAPVQAFARIADRSINLKEKIQNPDIVIVQDISVMDVVDVFNGIKENGIVIINTDKENIPVEREDLKVYTINASKIAMEIIGRPIMNTALLGAFAAVTGEISLDSIKEVIKNKFEESVSVKNIASAEAAYEAMGGGTK